MSQASELLDQPTATTEVPLDVQIAEAIAELQAYRDRLIAESEDTAKKAKMMKSAMNQQLEPELAKIDAGLKFLHEQQAALK